MCVHGVCVHRVVAAASDIAASSSQPSTTTAGQHISLDPGNSEGCVTINRAEGSAIWLALKHTLGTAIATDSATIMNMLMRPHSMKHNRNKGLLEDVVDLLRSYTEPSTFHKVRAHTGIPGNGHADWAVRQAAQQMAKQAVVGAPSEMDANPDINVATLCSTSVFGGSVDRCECRVQ